MYPFPYDDLQEILSYYENLIDVVWCQEEPANQGAWFSHRHRIQRVLDRFDTKREITLVSRPAAAAPAVGMMKLHLKTAEQSRRRGFKIGKIMAIEIKSPTFPESIADGTVAKWLKQEGESVNQDEVIAEIETDKVVLEVIAPSDGFVSKILKG